MTRKKPVGSAAENARRIRTKEIRKDIRALNRADSLSGSIREDYVRTKEHVNSVLDDSREDSTQYAVDRSEETVGVAAHQSVQQVRKGKEKLRKHTGKQGRKYAENSVSRGPVDRGDAQPHNSVDPVQHANKQKLIQQKKKEAEKLKSAKKNEMARTTGMENHAAQGNTETIAEDWPINSPGRDSSKSVIENTGRSGTGKADAVPTKKIIPRPVDYSVKGITRSVKIVSTDSPYPSIRTADQGKTIKTTAKSSGRATIKTAEHSVKGIHRAVKTAERSTKVTIKTVQKTSKAAVKTAKAAEKTAQQAMVKAQKAAITAQKAAEATVRVVIMITKAAAAAVKGLVTAGSALLIASLPLIILGAVIMGITVLFTGDTKREDEISSTADVVKQINEDYQLQMDIIQSRFSFDEVSVTGSRPTWEEVLSIYTAKSAGEPEKTWDEYTGLSMILWDMTTMTYTVEAQIPGETAVSLPQKELIRSVDVTFEFLTDGGYLKKAETVTYQRGGSENGDEGIAGLLPEEWAGKEITTILTVTMGSRSVEEMEERYGFSDNQKAQTQMLLSEDLAEFWLARIYGLTGSDEEIVKVALTQLGNTGGYPYWAYCGFSSRVEWCACFVSWCAGQCGYIEKGLIPNTGSPEVQVAWFKSQGKWQEGSITPTPGMIIFYDWYGKNFPDHVGIVEYVENGIVHTVEGNSSDSVRQRQYPVGDSRILGYGWILE